MKRASQERIEHIRITVADIAASKKAPQALHVIAAMELLAEIDALAASVQQLEAERNESEAEETLLRRLLWLRHGCPIIQLYGDDGEMQCGTCGIDFVRATAVTIEAIWRRAALAPTQRST